jgi:membrane protease YdiL (CAAX protease family)
MRRPFLPNGINPVQGVSMIERRDWKPEEVLRLTLRVLIGFVLSGLLQSLAMHQSSAGTQSADSWKALVLGQVCFHGTVVAAMVSFLRNQGRSWDQGFGLSAGGSVRAVGMGVLGGMAFLPAAYGLQWGIGTWLKTLGVELPVQTAVGILTEADIWGRSAIFLSAAFGAPWVEELLFRGVAYPFLRDLGWPRLALSGTAIAFGLIHANLSVLVPLTAFGCLLSLLYQHSGNLLTPIAAHVTFNTAPFVLLALDIRLDR